MPNFLTFDDGLTYIAFSEIESFGHQDRSDYKGGTWVKLRNGQTIDTHWTIIELSEKLGPTVNLHY